MGSFGRITSLKDSAVGQSNGRPYPSGDGAERKRDQGSEEAGGAEKELVVPDVLKKALSEKQGCENHIRKFSV
jgi:hypothetical protein